jgi:hypothetical protein
MCAHFFRCVLVPIVGLCLSSQLPAAEIKLFSVKDLAAKWLAEHKGIDASSELDAVIVELWTSDKKMAAVGRFENAILQNRPLDPDKNALHIALNFLKASDMKCSVVVQEKKDKPGPWIFTRSNGVIFSNGGHTTGLDFSATPRLKSLGKVECDLKFVADVDQFKETKDKPSTARLTLRAVITVSRKGSSTAYRRELGQYRITAGEDTALSKLPKWKSK